MKLSLSNIEQDRSKLQKQIWKLLILIKSNGSLLSVLGPAKCLSSNGRWLIIDFLKSEIYSGIVKQTNKHNKIIILCVPFLISIHVSRV